MRNGEIGGAVDDAAALWNRIERNPKIFLTRPETAVALNVSERWLELGAHEGYGPRVSRLGRRMVRYRGSALIEYAAAAEAGEAE